MASPRRSAGAVDPALILLDLLAEAGPAGIAPEEIERALPPSIPISRSTINRRLAEFVKEGVALPRGAGRAARYTLLSPLSFADVDKADYIRGMAAFYELGSTLVMEQTFIDGYVRSVIRGSAIPIRMRARGLDVGTIAGELSNFIHTGRKPADERARIFIA